MEGDEERISVLNEAQRKYNEGCNFIRQGDYQSAVNVLEQVLESRVKIFGALAPECASAYFKYGSALLYIAQQDADAFGSTKEKVEAEENGDDVSGDEDDVAEEDGDKEADGPEEDGDKEAGPVDAEEEAGKEDEDGEEEATDLELAWENLECARVIHDKQPGQSIEKADILVLLAELSLEKEDYDLCFRDYNSALQIMEELLQPDDRKLAEVCFKLCCAYQLAAKPKEAMEYICRAIAVCEQRLQRLAVDKVGGTKGKGKAIAVEEQEAASAAEAGDTADDQVRKEEVEEIKQLLVDLREKKEELSEMSKKSLLELLKAQRPEEIAFVETNCREAFSAVSSASSFSAAETAAPVKNLGVVGRGVKRMTPVSVPIRTTSGNGTAAAEAAQGPPKRRTLQDMMGDGETAQGFGSSAGAASGATETNGNVKSVSNGA